MAEPRDGQGTSTDGEILDAAQLRGNCGLAGVVREIFSRAGAAKDGYMSCAAKKRSTRDERESRKSRNKKKITKKKGTLQARGASEQLGRLCCCSIGNWRLGNFWQGRPSLNRAPEVGVASSGSIKLST